MHVAPFVLCMAGGPRLEPVWRSGPGDPDCAVSARNRVVHAVSAQNSGPQSGPGLPIFGAEIV